MNCRISQCDKPATSRELCYKHYARLRRHGDPLATLIEQHGLEGTPEYWVYRKMLARCYNPKQRYFNRYGGRGIQVCQRWRDSVVNFVADMGRRPNNTYELDRINNNGDYSPENCRWVTKVDQMNNTSYNRHVTYRGRMQTVAQWARELDVSYVVFHSRIARGWSPERAIETPIAGKFNGTG